LTTLEGCPESVGGNFLCENNPISEEITRLGRLNGYKKFIKEQRIKEFRKINRLNKYRFIRRQK